MGHLLKPIPSPVGKNFGLVFCKTSRYFLPPFVSDTIIAHRLFSSLSETAYISPLYLYTEHGEEVWKPNLSPDMTRKLTANINRDPTPVEIFDYVYGILHDPVYAEKYEEFLSRDYPRVPIVNVEEDKDNPYAFYVSEALFWEYVHFGSYLRDLHLMNTKVSLDLKIEPSDSENLEIEVASILINQGVDIVTVSKILGHERVSTTTDIYAKLLEGSSDTASKCIADVLLDKEAK